MLSHKLIVRKFLIIMTYRIIFFLQASKVYYLESQNRQIIFCVNSNLYPLDNTKYAIVLTETNIDSLLL